MLATLRKFIRTKFSQWKSTLPKVTMITLQKFIKRRFFQGLSVTEIPELPSGNSIGETLANKNYPKPESERRPYGESLGTTLARNNIPRKKQARQPYSRSSRHRCVLSIIVNTNGPIPPIRINYY